jgi:hypothetical protein
MDLKTISPTFGQFDSFGALVGVIVKNSFVLAGIISFLLLVFGGFSVIMAAGGGDTKEIEKGQKTITYAVLGLILVVTSYWIVQIIEKVSGVPLISP